MRPIPTVSSKGETLNTFQCLFSFFYACFQFRDVLKILFGKTVRTVTFPSHNFGPINGWYLNTAKIFASRRCMPDTWCSPSEKAVADIHMVARTLDSMRTTASTLFRSCHHHLSVIWVGCLPHCSLSIPCCLMVASRWPPRMGISSLFPAASHQDLL